MPRLLPVEIGVIRQGNIRVSYDAGILGAARRIPTIATRDWVTGRPPVKIQVVSGIGSGPTTLAAFDAALIDAGIANYNLIALSSVIPPRSELTFPDRAEHVSGQWGDRLYIVIAQERVEAPNVEAWSGIGWVQDAEDGKGLFVEHHGFSESAVRRDIDNSLRAMCESRGIDFGPVQMKVTGVTCEHEPVCSLVVAVFKHEGWA